MQDRRGAIQHEARRRAQAWADEEGATEGPAEVAGNRPKTSPLENGGFDNRPSRTANPVSSSVEGTGLPAVHNPASARRSSQLPPDIATCPRCRSTYDDTQRTPVLLVPCGHTVCKQCVKGTKAAASTCPLCGEAFHGTVINRAVTEAVRASLTEDVGVPNVTQPHLAPLPPGLGRAIAALREAAEPVAVSADGASQIERAARTALAHQRLAALRQGELALAGTERDDAGAAVQKQRDVEAALGHELQSIDRELERLRLERSVVLTQLAEALQRKSASMVREAQGSSREGTLQQHVVGHLEEVERARTAILHAAPPGVLQQLDEALDAERRRCLPES